MGLMEQHVAYKFVGGVETKMDSKAVPAVRLLALENGVFHRASSVKKRNGYSLRARAIDGTTDLITGARRLAGRDNELLLFTQAECYSKQTGADQWTNAGALVAPIGYDRAAVHTGTAQTTPDRATNRGVMVYAWEDSRGGVWWTAVDAENGRIYKEPTQANALAERPRCVAVGDALHVYYAVPTLTRVNVLVINPDAPTADVSELVLVEDLDSANPVYDACPTERDGTQAAMAWLENGSTDIRVGYVTAGGELGAPANGNPSVVTLTATRHATTPLGIAFLNSDPATPDDDIIALSYVSTTGAMRFLSGGDYTNGIAIGASVDNTAIGYATPVDVLRTTIVFGGAVAYAVWEEDATEPSDHYCVVNDCHTSGTNITGERTIRSLCLASKAFHAGELDTSAATTDGDTFAAFVHDTTYFNVYLTLRLSDFAPAGRHLPGSACETGRTHLPSVYVEDDIATFVVPYKTRVESENNDKFTESALRTVTMNFESEDSHQTVQFGRGLYLAAACPQHYAGRKWTEQGFHMGPEHITTSVGSGGSIASGTFVYIVWYEWTDDLGEIHRGPTSIGTEVVTGGASKKVTLTLPTLRVTRKENVHICVARSLDGDTSSMFRVSSLDPTTEGADNGYIANDTTVDTVTFVDAMSDADIALEEPLYTIGGILSNDPAPLGSHVAVGKNRLFFTDAQAGSVVRFSKRIATGFGAECAPEFAHDIDPLGGDITALATMDDVVYVFKASAIFAFNGDGPFENGESTGGGLVAGFSSSQIITSDVGCTDPSSIVLTPQGLMFKSAKGIRLLSRSREIVPVGDPVEAYNNQAVRRATVMPDRTAVLFLTDSGSSLYYDYQFGQWSTFTNHEGYDACVVDNSYYYLRTNDVVYQETIGQHADAGRRITLRFETAWLHLHEHLQGFQRFWKLILLGTWVSPHQLAVSHRMNYDEAWTAPYYLDATGDTDSTGWITEEVAATGTLYIGENDDWSAPWSTGFTAGAPALELRARQGGESGNSIVVEITDDEFTGSLITDTPTLVQVGGGNVTWSDIQTALDTSAYVEVTSAPANESGGVFPDSLTENDYQSVTLGGGETIFGSDPILGSDYGDGDYGDGAYGGLGPDVYQWRYGIHEDGQSIQFRFEDYEKAGLTDASFELTEMMIVGGIKKSDIRPFSAARST